MSSQFSVVQTRFYDRLASDAQIGLLFNSTPGVLYFVKDRDGHFISANHANLRWLGLKSEAQLAGTRDSDFFPAEMAEKFIQGDRKIVESAKAVIDEPELIIGADGVQKWFLTTKRPLFDRAGEVIGIAGITQSRTCS